MRLDLSSSLAAIAAIAAVAAVAAVAAAVAAVAAVAPTHTRGAQVWVTNIVYKFWKALGTISPMRCVELLNPQVPIFLRCFRSFVRPSVRSVGRSVVRSFVLHLSYDVCLK